VETRTRVDLPPQVTGTFEVFVSGVPQTEGADYERIGQSLFFTRTIEQEGKLGFVRWASIALGIAGTYRKNDSVDVIYESGGRRTVATLIPVVVVDPPATT